MKQILIGLVGIGIILGTALLLSNNRRAIRLRVVAGAFTLQVSIAVLVLYVPVGRKAIGALATGVAIVLGYSRAGIEMVFGGLTSVNNVASFAINVLPIIIFFSCVTSILYYLGVMQRVVQFIGGFLQRMLGVDRVEALSAAANILVGQSESPLLVRPYLPGLTEAQIFALMTSGMAAVAGSILAAYAQMGVKIEFLLAASFMSAPAGLLMAKIIMPDPRRSEIADRAAAPDGAVVSYTRPANLIMAAFIGTEDGVRLAISVGAMLIGFVGVIALCNGALEGLGGLVGLHGVTFQSVLGQLFGPVMLLLNVPWSEAKLAGELFGEKLILNEFVAYLHYSKVAASLSEHTQAVVTFALCGFANFASIAVQLAVLGGLVPDRRPQIAKLGVKAVLAGSLANLLSAALASLLLSITER
jgi:concentrative nucleoside transporter, CNT family